MRCLVTKPVLQFTITIDNLMALYRLTIHNNIGQVHSITPHDEKELGVISKHSLS